MNLSNKVYRRFGKIDLKNYIKDFFKIFNMKKGLVSIIIPYYKKKIFLKKLSYLLLIKAIKI